MSVRLSKLKESKVIVYEYLKDKYPGISFLLFYSIGQQYDDYAEQFLKIETNLDKTKWNDLKTEIENFLIKTDEHYIGLRIRITKMIYGKT